MSRGRRITNTYSNGEQLITPSNYRVRFWDLTMRQRVEVLEIISKRKLNHDEEWEAVEAVVSGATKAVRDERPPLYESVDYSRFYGR